MGTASLIIGIILIIIGFFLITQHLVSSSPTLEQWNNTLLAFLIIGIPMIVVGGLLLRKYDNDKKKENEPIQNKEPEVSWKYPILKGVIIGIIAVSIIFGGVYLILSQSFVVSTSGMEPALEVFDLIRSNKVPFNEIKVGDIIVFYSPSEQDKVTVHRVDAIINEDPLTIRAKGDARPTSIPGTDYPITEEEYIGRIDSIIPGGGYISRVYTPPLSIFIIIVAFVTPIDIMRILEKRKTLENS